MRRCSGARSGPVTGSGVLQAADSALTLCMAARKVHQGLGRQLTVGLGGSVNLGGVLDQFLPQSLADASAEELAARLRLLHPLLQRGIRYSEVWGDCVGVLQANLTLVSLESALTTHSIRSLGADGAPKADARRSHPLNLEVPHRCIHMSHPIYSSPHSSHMPHPTFFPVYTTGTLFKGAHGCKH